MKRVKLYLLKATEILNKLLQFTSDSKTWHSIVKHGVHDIIEKATMACN